MEARILDIASQLASCRIRSLRAIDPSWFSMCARSLWVSGMARTSLPSRRSRTFWTYALKVCQIGRLGTVRASSKSASGVRLSYVLRATGASRRRAQQTPWSRLAGQGPSL